MIIVYSAMQIYCINQLSINYDEGSFASYGTSLLKFQGEKDVIQYESKLPITALNMIPRALQQIFKPNLKKTWPEATSDIIHGRYVSLFVSILLGLLIFKWSKEIYNEKTALLVLLLYLLCPNFLAHGIFVSSDIFACFFITMALYYLWNFFHQQKTKYFILMSVATGLAQVSKFSMVHLFIIIPLLSVTICLSRSGNDGITRAFSIRKTLVYSALFIFVNWFIICTSHLFYQVFLPIKDYTFISVPFKGLQ